MAVNQASITANSIRPADLIDLYTAVIYFFDYKTTV